MKFVWCSFKSKPVLAGSKNDQKPERKSMLVELKKMAERPENAGRLYKPPVEIHHSAEMEPAEFAFKYASALLANPLLNCKADGYYVGEMAVFAVIFGEDPELFYGKSNSSGSEFYHYPECVKMNEVLKNLIQVTIGPNHEDEHYFFRITSSGLTYLPYGKGCNVTTTSAKQVAFSPSMDVERDNLAWPWIALFPEKFAGVIEFADLLDPYDENPLTGLISAKDAPVRTLAKQIASRLTRSRDKWIRDIVSSL